MRFYLPSRAALALVLLLLAGIVYSGCSGAGATVLAPVAPVPPLAQEPPPAASPPSKVSRFLAYPPGNIINLSAPSALAALQNVNSQWWFLAGRLTSSSGPHSLQLNVINTSVLSLTNFDFTFDVGGGSETPGGKSFLASTNYGGESPANVAQAIRNSLGLLSSSAADNDFQLTVSSPQISLRYNAAKSERQPSMYLGHVGQPGAHYDYQATGQAFLTQFTSQQELEPVLYKFTLKMELVDERGLVQEGWGAYVGADPSDPKPLIGTNTSVEYALPLLRVKSWAISFSNPQPGSGYEARYDFGSVAGTDVLWLDRQSLFQEGAGTALARAVPGQLVTRALAQTNEKLGFVPTDPNSPPANVSHNQLLQAVQSEVLELQDDQQLYLGCWHALAFTDGPYEGATAVFVAFWKQGKFVADYDTQAGDALNGFMNLFTGLLVRDGIYDPVSAFSMTDVLVLDKSTGGTVSPLPSPYRIQLTDPFQKIGNLEDPQRFASTVKLTVKAGTQARYALAAYARRAGRSESVGVDQDLVFTLKAVSPYAVVIQVSKSLGPPYYEGAGTIFDESGTEVGSAWLEQMVGSPSP